MLSLYKSIPTFCLFVLVLSTSCSSEPKGDLEAIQMFEKRILLTNRELKENNKLVLTATKERLAELESREKARIWYPKAQNVHNSTSKMIAYLEELKEELKTIAGYRGNGDSAVLTINNPEIVSKFFKDKDRAKKLYQRLIQYQNQVDVDSIIYKNYLQGLDSSVLNYIESLSFDQKYSLNATLAMFNLFENCVLRVESKLLAFCHEHTSVWTHEYLFFSAIVGQSHSHLKAGEMLEISAGIGNFSKDSKLQIQIADSLISMNQDGVAVYKIRASQKTGKHVIPVKLKFIDLNGKQNEVSKQIEYTVVKG